MNHERLRRSPFSAEYWIVNLAERVVEVYTQPRAGKAAGFRTQRDFGINEWIPLVLAGRKVSEIPVSELLP
jgi:hypothetical protein